MRTTITLGERRMARLKELAAARNCSMAQIIREGVDLALEFSERIVKARKAWGEMVEEQLKSNQVRG